MERTGGEWVCVGGGDGVIGKNIGDNYREQFCIKCTDSNLEPPQILVYFLSRSHVLPISTLDSSVIRQQRMVGVRG